jgi:hypothetical protein
METAQGFLMFIIGAGIVFLVWYLWTHCKVKTLSVVSTASPTTTGGIPLNTGA